MQNALATVILIAATLVLIGLTIFSDDGAFGDASTQKTRAHTISENTTIPTKLK
jgi:hypothetical protein